MAAHLPSMVRTAYDFELYQEVATQRARRTAGYFTLLVLISTVIVSVATTLQQRTVIRRDILPEIAKWPVVTIKNHEASANVPQPWVKKFVDPDSNQTFLFTIDTTGKTTDFADGEVGLILTKTHLLMRQQSMPMTRDMPLDTVDDMVIDPATLGKYVPTVLWITFAVLLGVLALYYAAVRLVHGVLLSVVGLIVNTTRRRGLSFGSIYAISLYALTPAIALDMLCSCANLNIPYFWFFYLLLGGLFTGIAIKKIPDLPPPGPPAPGSLYG